MRARRWTTTAMIGAIGAIVAVGCGIPEEQHNEALAKIKRLRAESAAERKACAEMRQDLENKNGQLASENKVMKTRLVQLGQDLTKLKGEKGQIIQNLSKKEQQIAQLLKAQAAARKRAAMFRKLLASFKQMIDSGKLKVNVRKGRMVVQLSDKILFDSGKARLKKAGKGALEQVTQILAAVQGRNFQVAGHTDNIPIRTRRFKSNWALSAARAVQVVKFMVKKGMPKARISAAGYADTDPVGDNATEEGRALNRRVELHRAGG